MIRVKAAAHSLQAMDHRLLERYFSNIPCRHAGRFHAGRFAEFAMDVTYCSRVQVSMRVN